MNGTAFEASQQTDNCRVAARARRPFGAPDGHDGHRTFVAQYPRARPAGARGEARRRSAIRAARGLALSVRLGVFAAHSGPLVRSLWPAPGGACRPVSHRRVQSWRHGCRVDRRDHSCAHPAIAERIGRPRDRPRDHSRSLRSRARGLDDRLGGDRHGRRADGRAADRRPPRYRVRVGSNLPVRCPHQRGGRAFSGGRGGSSPVGGVSRVWVRRTEPSEGGAPPPPPSPRRDFGGGMDDEA